ncbi:ANGP2 protein, partial [Crypturellus undulatus]|nr:ANGP2 protein [Crypturellus undulatus]
QLESYIQASVRPEAAQLQRAAVRNQTAAVLEMGSSLLNRTAEQTRKLTDVEAQVLNQTSRLELQLLETSLSTSKLEKQLLLQTNEIHKLQDRNSVLELRVLELESKQQDPAASCPAAPRWHSVRDNIPWEDARGMLLHSPASHSALGGLRSGAGSMRTPRGPHCWVLAHGGSHCWVPAPLGSRPGSVHIALGPHHLSRHTGVPIAPAPLGSSPVSLPQAFCDMETDRGGWTVMQLRANGSVSFQRTWKEYKQVCAAVPARPPGPPLDPAHRAAPQGFGEPAGEHWLGNEAVHLLTSRAPYALRVELLDWEGTQALAHYERFQLGSERQLYRLALQGYSGTAGQQSAMALQGANFSTRDADHDNCLCKCAQMLSGGWWFDACGLSNLNGVYYPARHNARKLNGIRWHRFQGPSYSLKGTRMLIRPASF